MNEKSKQNKKNIEVCKKEGFNIEEVRGGSRRRFSEIRVKLVKELVKDYSITLANTARQLGVSTLAIP